LIEFDQIYEDYKNNYLLGRTLCSIISSYDMCGGRINSFRNCHSVNCSNEKLFSSTYWKIV